jgi:4-hydroxybenzoate polyprenyltransferase
MLKYIQLMRLDRPVGIYLLWFPIAFALWVGSDGMPPFATLGIFALGTIVLRSLGCVWNDIVDRNIDPFVDRTKLRPLASKAVTVYQAWVLMGILGCIALSLLYFLPRSCIYTAMISVGLVAIYPFCKRWIEAPQCVLGLAFSIGMFMVYQALGRPFDADIWILWTINVVWVVMYDTQYAMTDRADDRKIGVRSSALWFGEKVEAWIWGLQILSHMMWIYFMHSWVFTACWCVGGVIFIYQHRDMAKHAYMKAFYLNVWYGLVMWIGLMGNYGIGGLLHPQVV